MGLSGEEIGGARVSAVQWSSKLEPHMHVPGFVTPRAWLGRATLHDSKSLGCSDVFLTFAEIKSSSEHHGDGQF